MRVEHVALWTNQPEQMRDFYVRYFHAQAGARTQHTAAPFASVMLAFADGARLELLHAPEPLPAPSPPGAPAVGFAHIAFTVGAAEQVDALTAQLRRDGIVIADEPRWTGDGYYESTVHDPDGNRVEITAVPAEIGGLNAAEFAAIVEGLRALPLELRWGHIAHDLRNPVSLIGASAQLLAMAADKLEPEDRQILSILENAADRLHTLIDAYIEAHKPDTSV